MNRTKNSFFNAISALLMTFIYGILGLIVTRAVILMYGSDFNGLNSTANQIISVLLILEGGFTMASNVSLFGSYTRGDYDVVNWGLRTTRKKFKYIGFWFTVIGCLTALVFSILANTQVSRLVCFTVIMMALIPSCVDLYFVSAYRVLLKTQQKEYVINLVSMITIVAGYGLNGISIAFRMPNWTIRFGTMLTGLASCLLIRSWVIRHNSFLDLKHRKEENAPIPGTRDVLIQKITGAVYSSAPIIFLAILPSGGTVLVSVYAVYNNVFAMIKNLLHSVVDAPRLSIGQMLTEKDKRDVWNIFRTYELVTIWILFVSVVCTYALILPFVKLYTTGITDTDYYNAVIPIIMALIAVFELIHIPSGNLINMAGLFAVSKKFQLIACIVLIGTMLFGGMVFGVYGILVAVLIVAILLAVLEIGYVHNVFFKSTFIQFWFSLIPYCVLGLVLCAVEHKLFVNINSIREFVLAAALSLIINSIACFVVAFVFHRKDFLAFIERMFGMIKTK